MGVGVLVLYVSSALGRPYAAAQDLPKHPLLGVGCIDLNQTAMDYIAAGRFKDAESTLSSGLADPASGSGKLCGWLTLHNLATNLSLSGRLVEAEAFEQRSLKILETGYPPNHWILLRPLQFLIRIQLEQREIAKARETLKRLQSIPSEWPADRATIHGLAAGLLYREGRHHEAEAEYLKALEAWKVAGRGETADAAAVLDGLAVLYIADGRNGDAGRTLDRTLAILTSAKDAVAADWIKLLSARAALYVRQRKWREAEADLRTAVSTADRDTRLDPALLKPLLAGYAYVLRRNHRGKEARSIRARAAAIPSGESTNALVDLSELLAKSRNDQK